MTVSVLRRSTHIVCQVYDSDLDELVQVQVRAGRLTGTMRPLCRRCRSIDCPHVDTVLAYLETLPELIRAR